MRWGRLVAVLLVVVALLGAGAVVAVSWQSAEELIHPVRERAAESPSNLSLSYEDVTLVTDDGLRLAGWWMPAQAPSRGTVVFLHGYGDSKAQALEVAPFLHEGGYGVLAFDFRAHGDSEGQTTTVGLVETEDVEAAVRHVLSRDDADPRIALFGWSMGAAAGLNAAEDLPEVQAIVSDSGFATLENIAGNSITHFTGLPQYPFGPLAVLFAGWKVGHDVGDNRPVDRMADLGRPVLVIQGEADDIAFASDDGRALADAAPPGSDYWLVPGASHVQAIAVEPEAYEARVLAFLDAHLR